MQGRVGQRVRVIMTGSLFERWGTILEVVDDDEADYHHYEVLLDDDTEPTTLLESMLSFHLSMPDPPGTTRLEIIREKLGVNDG